MEFTDFNVVNVWFKVNENERNHIDYMRTRSTIWNSNFSPRDAAMWLIVSRLNLGIRKQELAINYLDEIEGGIFSNFTEVRKDFYQLKVSNPSLFFIE